MSRFAHPRMVNLNVTCNSEEEVLRVFEVLGRVAAGLTVDNYDTEIGSYSFNPDDEDEDEDEFLRKQGEDGE